MDFNYRWQKKFINLERAVKVVKIKLGKQNKRVTFEVRDEQVCPNEE